MSQPAKGTRRPWAPEEDEAIKSLVLLNGTKRWTIISEQLERDYNISSRSGKQCRERWHNHLNPEIVKRPWEIEEERLMFETHRTLGNRWADIAKCLPGRSDNDIKNHFYSTIRKFCRKKLGSYASKEQIQKYDEQLTTAVLSSLQRRKKPMKTRCRTIPVPIEAQTPEESPQDLSYWSDSLETWSCQTERDAYQWQLDHWQDFLTTQDSDECLVQLDVV